MLSISPGNLYLIYYLSGVPLTSVVCSGQPNFNRAVYANFEFLQNLIFNNGVLFIKLR